MSAYRLSPAARADLSDIWDFTVERWGEAQAERYVRQLAGACADLASGRRKGQSIDAIRPGYYRHRSGAHILFYRFSGAGAIEVIRILHQSMDVDRHL